MAEPLPLSVAIITKNEEANLARCLESVSGLAQETVILDSGSTDGTEAIARRYGARFEVTDWPGHVRQKNRALSRCRSQWVLSLDADEALSDTLRAALLRLFEAGEPSADGYEVNRLNRYLGAWIRHAWYPEWRLRLVRREKAEWVGVDPHDYLQVRGRVERLQGDLLHYSYRDLEDHFQRTIMYARIGAEQQIKNGRPVRWHQLLLSPWVRLFRSLVVKQSWRDGWRGWIIAMSSMFSCFAKYAFMLERELRRQGLDEKH